MTHISHCQCLHNSHNKQADNYSDDIDDDAMPQAAPLKSLQAYYTRKAAAADDNDNDEGGDAPSGESLYAYANTNPARRG
jgi:hypothetical protein